MSHPPKWSKDDCIEAVKAYEAFAARIGQEPSLHRYGEWAKGQKDRPSDGTLKIQFGTWNNARACSHRGESIGLNVLHQPKRKWFVQTILSALVRYERHCKETHQRPTRDFYQEWQKQHSDAPSVDTVERLGSWNQMRLRAAENPEEVRLFPAPYRRAKMTYPGS